MTCDDAADVLSLIALSLIAFSLITLLTYSLLFNAYTVTNLRSTFDCRSHHPCFGVPSCCVS